MKDNNLNSEDPRSINTQTVEEFKNPAERNAFRNNFSNFYLFSVIIYRIADSRVTCKMV